MSTATSATPWHAIPLEDTFAELETGPDGLSPEEARKRLERDGPNVIARVSAESPLRILWRQIYNPLIGVLIVSAAVAMAVGKVVDGAVVLAVGVLNALIGFVQEFRATRAIEALSGMVPESVTVVRGGRRSTLPAAELVSGDVIALGAGDKVPADLRLVATKNLAIEEAALTGESIPTEKSTAPAAPDALLGDRSSMAFGGTLVTYGTGTGVVVATGARTELGRISTMLAEVVELETPLTRALAKIGTLISVGIVAVSAVLLTVGTVRATAAGLPIGAALEETLIFAIALAVGAIPEGLPAIVTIALAIGVQRMAARKAIIRRLPAVETLGSTTVICSDKTGTLTKNEMTVVALWTPSGGTLRVAGVGYEPTGTFHAPDGGEAIEPPEEARHLLVAAALCSDASLEARDGSFHVTGDPTEGALVVAAEKAGLDVETLRREHPRLDTIPFESEHRFMATLHRSDGGSRAYVKGAPESLLGRTAEDGGDEVHAIVEDFAREGLRVLAIAELASPRESLEFSDLDAGLRLLGLVAMIDPPRRESISAVEACRAAGVAVKMITGDHRTTAAAIGRELGLESDLSLDGKALAALDQEGLVKAARTVSVFARVAPEHKLELVRTLANDGQVVAMTGDGVNDAPALKQANIGIAMGITGTSVAKEASDVVLTDDNFATIVAAVEEGRRVYDNLIKSLAFVLPTNLGLALILTVALVAFPIDPATRLLLLPIEPTQIPWINLVATVALALPLAFEAKEPDVMSRPPRRPDEPLLSRFVVRRTILAAVLMTAAAVGLFLFEYARYLDRGTTERHALAEAQTMAVTTVIFFQIFYVLSCRSLRESVLKIGLFSNPYVYVGIAGLLLLQLAFIYAPPLQAVFGTTALAPRELALSALAGTVINPVIGLEKWIGAKLRRRRGARLRRRSAA